jgi:hypothetical protein
MCNEHVKLFQATDVNSYVFYSHFNLTFHILNKSVANNMYCEQSKYCILVYLFLVHIVHDVITISDSVASKDEVILIGKDVHNCRYCPRNYPEGLRKTEL